MGAPTTTDKRTSLGQPAALIESDAAREALRAEARRKLGITKGVREDVAPLRETLQHHGLSIYPLAAICVLTVVDVFYGHAFAVFAPDISRTLGIGRGAIAALIALKTLAVTLGPLPMAALAQAPRRALLALCAGLVMSIATVASGFVTAIWGLLVLMIIDGMTTGGAAALHRPLIMDTYPPEGRVRSLTAYQAFDAVDSLIGPLGIAALAGWLGFTWRGVFVVFGVASLLGTVFAIRLRDPGFGRWDTDRIRETVLARGAGDHASLRPDVELGFFEIARRLFLIPTVRRLITAFSIFGVLLIPFQSFFFFFLEERWNLDAGQRALFFAYLSGVSIISITLLSRRNERTFRENPGLLLKRAGLALAVAVVIIALGALSPSFPLLVILYGFAWSVTAFVGLSLPAVLLSVVPSRMRPHTGALIGLFYAGVGGMMGALFLSGIDRRFGITGTIVALLVPGIGAALTIASAAKLVMPDLDRMIDEIIEDAELTKMRASGHHLPLLACRNVSFSYGQLQVLFNVDFTCDDGEMVALLGVNGAGKSTLLRVISGLGLPSAGSVRFQGEDVTYLDAERRVRLGITQIPGGRAVFGSMSVVDNLRLFGYTFQRDRNAVDEAIERSFATFPRLYERRSQPAATLSGGEQQMLGLSKALIVQPKLLLIDELSLGLAPVIVEQLLVIVREINARGTAIILVEQSVNIALSLVEHAYFMEKGEIRFDGNARELLTRDDLLRAVFLHGAEATTREGSG